jgi:hypothetical protein
MLNQTPPIDPFNGIAEVLGLLLAWGIILFVMFMCCLALAAVKEEQRCWKIRTRARRIKKIREKRNETSV